MDTARFNAAVAAASSPSRTEVVAAKKAVLEAIADGEPHAAMVLLNSGGVSNPPAAAASAAELETVLASHPMVMHWRRRRGTAEGLAELVGEGVVIPVSDANGQFRQPNNGLNEINLSISISGSTSSMSTNLTVQLPAPEVSAAKYQLAHRLRGTPLPWLLDVDLFSADLASLALNGHAHRCLAEALDAFRRSLYLACANMLGAAWEGAWYDAGRLLCGFDTRLEKALDTKQAKTAAVMDRVAELLRGNGGFGAEAANELQSHGGLMRWLRNYAIHPRDAGDIDPRDRYLSEEGCALLLATTHRGLMTLAEQTAAAVKRLSP